MANNIFATEMHRDWDSHMELKSRSRVNAKTLFT